MPSWPLGLCELMDCMVQPVPHGTEVSQGTPRPPGVLTRKRGSCSIHFRGEGPHFSDSNVWSMKYSSPLQGEPLPRLGRSWGLSEGLQGAVGQGSGSTPSQDCWLFQGKRGQEETPDLVRALWPLGGPGLCTPRVLGPTLGSPPAWGPACTLGGLYPARMGLRVISRWQQHWEPCS